MRELALPPIWSSLQVVSSTRSPEYLLVWIAVATSQVSTIWMGYFQTRYQLSSFHMSMHCGTASQPWTPFAQTAASPTFSLFTRILLCQKLILRYRMSTSHSLTLVFEGSRVIASRVTNRVLISDSDPSKQVCDHSRISHPYTSKYCTWRRLFCHLI